MVGTQSGQYRATVVERAREVIHPGPGCDNLSTPGQNVIGFAVTTAPNVDTQNQRALEQRKSAHESARKELSEEVFVAQPPGYEKKGHEQKVYRLKKALYGLKQAPRAWYSRIESYFVREGFEKCPYEHTLFTKTKNGGMLIVCLYVDDLIFTGNDESMFKEFKQSMMVEFEMTDLGKISYFLGIEVLQRTDGIFISQRKYAQEVLERFNMDQCNPVHNPMVPGFKLVKDEGGVRVDSTLYKQMVGSLMYLMATRSDMMFVKGGDEELVGYTDNDYAGDQDDRKSTSGYIFMIGLGAVLWSSRKQHVVTLSTTEAEFISADRALVKPYAIKLSKNPCTTQEQVADLLTKPVKLENCCFVRVWGGGGNRRSGKVFAEVKSVDKFEKGLNDVVSGKEDLEVEFAAEVSWLREFPKRSVIVVLCFSDFLLRNMDTVSLKLEALTTMKCVTETIAAYAVPSPSEG
ncbi:hypothetical protein FF1_006000 [Malus domestica]